MLPSLDAHLRQGSRVGLAPQPHIVGGLHASFDGARQNAQGGAGFRRAPFELGCVLG